MRRRRRSSRSARQTKGLRTHLAPNPDLPIPDFCNKICQLQTHALQQMHLSMAPLPRSGHALACGAVTRRSRVQAQPRALIEIALSNGRVVKVEGEYRSGDSGRGSLQRTIMRMGEPRQYRFDTLAHASIGPGKKDHVQIKFWPRGKSVENWNAVRRNELRNDDQAPFQAAHSR